MGDHGFFVTLPSNACGKTFPNNKSSAYTIQLARALDLPGAWEVGLVEIQYPHSWDTVTTDAQFELCTADMEHRFHYVLNPGYYADIPELLESMNRLIHHDAQAFLHYSPVTRKIILLHHDNMSKKNSAKPTEKFYLKCDAQLGNILGLLPDQSVKIAPFPADITAGFNSLYIYTDIVEHQIVGDFYVPLLRCVPVRGENNECVTIGYDKPHYIPISKDHIDTITIEIKNDQNKNIPFRFGKVTVKLHFRPRRTFVF